MNLPMPQHWRRQADKLLADHPRHRIAGAFLMIGIIAGTLLGASSTVLLSDSTGALVPTPITTTPEDTDAAGTELPSTVRLGYGWDHVGPRLVESGAIDLTRLQLLHEQRGTPMSDTQLAFFTEGTDDPIVFTQENSGFLLNTLWALGITNENPILEDGRMQQLRAAGGADRLASTGGWPLGTKPGGQLLDSVRIIELTPAQQQRVEHVVTKAYRPCCNNPTSFPDCNHGAASLALAQLLASQGASETEIADALKQANAMWFPQQYTELAIYFKEVKGQDWDDVDAMTVLGKEYSSASGWRSVHQELQQKRLLPETGGSGASCGV